MFSRFFLISCSIWLITVGTGFGVLYEYANRPSVVLTPVPIWPASSKIHFDESKANLVMMVHPHCACSRASLGELERLLAQSAGKAKAHVVFLKPGQFPDSWVNTDTWRRAKSLPDVEVVDDVDGAEAKLFSATTSGQTFLYDSKGRLIFSGGITGARGHEGDNKGRSTIVDWLNHGTLAVKETFVFGCSLFATGQEENN